MSDTRQPVSPHPQFSNETIPLWPDDSPNNGSNPEYRPMIRITYPALRGAGEQDLATKPKLAAVLVCPGGGYERQAPHEGQPFAQLLAIHGIVAAVLTYRVSPDRFPAAYCDAARAMRVLRSRAATYAIDPGRIGIMGFSAGGHLASTIATQPKLHIDPGDDLADSTSARPDRVILAYPVVTMLDGTHEGSRRALLGEEPTREMKERLSGDLQVAPDSPPAFLFHTADDESVPVTNALRYASACAHRGVPFELHVHGSGPHGIGMAAGDPSLRGWTEALIEWLRPWTRE
ncbi:MAG: alpha/beta hydrolase [Spirochaetota bacterium]